MIPLTPKQQVNKRIREIEDHILNLRSDRAYINERRNKKDKSLFPFLYPNEMTLEYEYNMLTETIQYLEDYVTMLCNTKYD